MARSRSRGSLLLAIARESAKQQRVAEAAQRRAHANAERIQRATYRDSERARRETTRAAKEAERDAKARYLLDRDEEVSNKNIELEDIINELNSILDSTLAIDDTVRFESLRIHDDPPVFSPPEQLLTPELEPNEGYFLGTVVEPGSLKSLIPGAKKRYQQNLEIAKENYRDALEKWKTKEKTRVEKLHSVKSQYDSLFEAYQRKKAERNTEVDSLEAGYLAGEPDSIIAYCNMVLERSSYPEKFPQKFSLAYTNLSKQLIVEYELPGFDIIPTVEEYKYVKSTDVISEKPRKANDTKYLYQEIIASTSLRTIHEIFESDQGDHIDVVCFNGYIHTVDPATGRDIQPHLISVRTTKQKFLEIDLHRIDKRICLTNLGAQVSRHPTEAQPVKPIVEFDMADARYIDQTDLISGLSSAINLMDLNPYEFEQLVANLFGKMGLESKLTRSSRDGGVDCVAYDSRPVLGGKVVIQAKRYRNTVGVSAVRDLYGTMMNEGANKGILVTTSGYGPDAFDFAKDKPIELVDGGGLLYLLRETGVEARIVFPQE